MLVGPFEGSEPAEGEGLDDGVVLFDGAGVAEGVADGFGVATGVEEGAGELAGTDVLPLLIRKTEFPPVTVCEYVIESVYGMRMIVLFCF